MAPRPVVHKGMVVRSRDGVPLGRVVAVDDEGFVVERRVVVPREFRVGVREVYTLEGGDVILSWEREDLPELTAVEPPSRGERGVLGGLPESPGAWELPE